MRLSPRAIRSIREACLTQIANIARNAIRRGYGVEMLRKLWIRWRERDTAKREEAIRWCRDQAIDATAWACSIDPGLWEEAERFASEQQQRAERLSGELNVPLGGAGFYELLFFLVRLLRPETIVETGVAFGFSSRAFLAALDRNDRPSGRLYSSDFPYFRLADPERIIGCLVEPELRDRWTLLIGGDRKNLRRLRQDVPRIDLLHYDSDKSYSGRSFAVRMLQPRLGPDAPILFDDIQDNFHFRDLVEAGARRHLIFAFGGKWIGLTGGPDRLYEGRGVTS